MSDNEEREKQDGGRRDESAVPVRIAWLDADEHQTVSPGRRFVTRVASICAAVWILARLAFIYVAVPCLALVTLAVVLSLFRTRPFLAGLIIAVCVGVGVGYYYDQITDPE